MSDVRYLLIQTCKTKLARCDDVTHLLCHWTWLWNRLLYVQRHRPEQLVILLTVGEIAEALFIRSSWAGAAVSLLVLLGREAGCLWEGRCS